MAKLYFSRWAGDPSKNASTAKFILSYWGNHTILPDCRVDMTIGVTTTIYVAATGRIAVQLARFNYGSELLLLMFLACKNAKLSDAFVHQLKLRDA